MSLKQKAVNGVKWNVVSQVSCTVMHLLRLAVLTRLLDKSDFGLIAIAMMVISFTEIFSELGMTVGIIHKQDITADQYSSVYWLNVMMSILVFGIVWIISPLFARFYNEPILTTIIPLLGIQILFNAFGKMFQTIKSKNLEFDFISKVRIFSTFVGFILAVVLAYIGWGIYSLVWAQVIQIGLNQSIYAIKGHGQLKIRMHFRLCEIKDFVQIGTYRLGAQILDFISSKLDVFLIGRFFGMDDLGIYNIAKDLIVRPYTIINALVGSVGASVFAKIQNNIEMVKEHFGKVVNMASIICIPVYVAAFVFADAIVAIMYAQEYAAVAIFIRILAFVGIESSISSQTGMLQIAYGRTDLSLKWTVFRVFFSSVAILIASKFDIYAVAYGQLFIAIVSLFVFWRIVLYPISKIRLFDYFKMFSEPLIVAFVCAIPFFVLCLFANSVALQCLLACLFFAAYGGYYCFARKSYTQSMISMLIRK